MISDNHSTQTDEALLQAYRTTGDNQWLGTLLQRYTLLLYGVAIKYLKDKEAAQDAVQQVFLKVLTHLPQEEIQNFKGWLYILMRNHCLQLLRNKAYQLGEEALQHMSGADTGVADALLKEYTLAQLNEAIRALNEEQRQCIVLFYLEKMSYQQIMERTGYNFMQVKSHIQNGKRNLKTILMKKLGKH